MKIAIAEDQDEIRQFFQTVVQRLGHEVVAAAKNGRELIEQASAEWPDLIITDMQMPEMDGVEATRRICREHPVPVIVISACDRAEVSRGDGSAHVTTFLVKPVSIRDLKSAINNAAGGASA